MTTLQAVVLGVIQGLTEFLPISSSAHLVFIPKFLGWADQGLGFDAVVHLGTLFAVVVYFRKRIWHLVCAFLSLRASPFCHCDPPLREGGGKQSNEEEKRLAWLVILTVVPSLAAGFLMSEVFEIEIRSPLVIAVSLIFWGIILGIADRYHALRKTYHKPIESLTWGRAFFVACAQAVALIPGTSRSGITMTAGLFSKLSREAAAEFSFLMSVPVIAVAGGFKVFQLLSQGIPAGAGASYIAGFAASAAAGFAAIWTLMRIIKKWNFLPFAAYRVAVGVLILIMLV